MKLELVAGVEGSPREVADRVVTMIGNDGGEVVGQVVFGEVGSTLQVYASGPRWPEDVETWATYADALQAMVAAAREDQRENRKNSESVGRQN